MHLSALLGDRVEAGDPAALDLLCGAATRAAATLEARSATENGPMLVVVDDQLASIGSLPVVGHARWAP